MPKVTFKERTGSHLFEFMSRSIVDIQLAQNWALVNFVLIDGQPIENKDLGKIKPIDIFRLSNSVFGSDYKYIKNIQDIEVIFDPENLTKYPTLKVPYREITRDFITEIQTFNTQRQGKKINPKDNIDLMKKCILKMFDTDLETLENYHYSLPMFLVERVSYFLSEYSRPSDEFEIELIRS